MGTPAEDRATTTRTGVASHLVLVRFTERELTAGVDAVARHLFAATRPPWRRGRLEQEWQALAPIEKYNRRSAAGEMVLPALQALPERPTVGTHPVFSDEEYAGAAESATRTLLEHRSQGAWDAMPERRRKRLVRTTASLTRQAVEGMPVRQDPDDLAVPDHL